MEFLIKVVYFILCTSLEYLAAQCPDSWFGSKCQYQCHCKSDSKCGSDGQCAGKCNAGWFGRECQYVDLTTVDGAQISTSAASSSTLWLTDRDMTTCNEDPSLDSITVEWDRPYPFTWLRLQAKNSTILLFNFTFTNSHSSYYCTNQLIALMDATTADYRCEINDTVTRLTVRGSSLNGLCSLYISGGRNVALKQTTEQTETYENYFASLAVDGYTNSDFGKNTCTHTTVDSALSVYPASWTLILDNPRVVNRIKIFNRVDCCTERLETFRLLLLDSDNNIIWTYDNLESSVVYTLNTLQQKPVKTVRILATKNDTQFHFPILTLCEVMVFGDCELGTWGLGCTSPCPIECKGFCQQETGKCYQCLGYLDPPHCSQDCALGKWGLNCSYDCNNLCLQQICDRVTGLCSQHTPTTVAALVSESCNSPGLGAGIGIGIAIGVITIAVIEVALYFIFTKRRKPPDIANEPVHKTQVIPRQHYDTVKDSTQVKPHYDTIDLNDMNSVQVVTATSSTNSSSYENEITQYETYSPKNVYK